MTEMRIVNLTTCQARQAPLVILEDQQAAAVKLADRTGYK